MPRRRNLAMPWLNDSDDMSNTAGVTLEDRDAKIEALSEGR